MQLAIVARRATDTNLALAAAAPRGVEFTLLTPEEALETLGRGDAALGRLDVLPTLDGVDDGLWALGSLAASGLRTLNRASALMAAHDKLLTARLMFRAGLPHPRTRLLSPGELLPELGPPLVVRRPASGRRGRLGRPRAERRRRAHARVRDRARPLRSRRLGARPGRGLPPGRVAQTRPQMLLHSAPVAAA